MANYARLAALCILLLSCTNLAFGKIRGTVNKERGISLESITTTDEAVSRQLMDRFKKNRNGHGHMNHNGKNGKRKSEDGKETDAKGAKGEGGAKGGGAKGGTGEDHEIAADEDHEPEEGHEAEEDHAHEFGGLDHHHHEHGHGETATPDGDDDEAYTVHKSGNKGGNKGGTKGGKEHKGHKGHRGHKGGKHKGGKNKSASVTGGEKGGSKGGEKGGSKGGEKGGSKGGEKGGSKYSKSVKGYDKGDKGGKSGKSHNKYGGSGSKKGSGKSDKYKYVSKKSRSHKSPGGSHKSANKLKKSSHDSYSHDEPTVHPSDGSIEPTLVQVPMSFYFAFEEEAERRLRRAERQLDGHNSFEPTPEEIEALKEAIQEYADGLFEYLHDTNPDSFYSVTATLDAVFIHPGEPYPLQVDVTFDILYNEHPDDVPDPEEVASILEGAYTTDEFTYFYLWGHENIWNHVSSVKVEPNFDESHAPDVPSGSTDDSVVDVWATMVYGFGVNPTSEPTEADYDLLVSLTEAFFTDLLADKYNDSPETTFETLSIDRHATTFDLEATPPVIIDYSFKVDFAEDGDAPSSDELFKIMAQTMFDDYIRLHLEPSESIWSTVDRVSLLEYSGPEGTSADTDEETVTEELVPPVSTNLVPATIAYSFFPDTATRPDKEDYEKLEIATNLFFIERLTAAYANNSDTDFVMASTEIRSTFFDGNATEPLAVDYVTNTVMEGVPVESDEIFTLLQGSDWTAYIMEFLWKEGEPWTNVNGVMYVERIEAEPAS